MRQILISHARARSAEKRGGGEQAVELQETTVGVDGEPNIDVLDLHEALQELARIDDAQAQGGGASLLCRTDGTRGGRGARSERHYDRKRMAGVACVAAGAVAVSRVMGTEPPFKGMGPF